MPEVVVGVAVALILIVIVVSVIAGPRCPYCGSENIVVHPAVYVYGDTNGHRATCDVCQESWIE